MGNAEDAADKLMGASKSCRGSRELKLMVKDAVALLPHSWCSEASLLAVTQNSSDACVCPYLAFVHKGAWLLKLPAGGRPFLQLLA